MPSPNRVKANAHMGRLLKRRDKEQRPTNLRQPFDWKWLMSVCRPSESPRSKLLQVKDRGTE
jgi:hypothetical protein